MPLVEEQVIYTQTTERTQTEITRLENGKYIGRVVYKGVQFVTQEADDEKQARQFAYFILHEVSGGGNGWPQNHN